MNFINAEAIFIKKGITRMKTNITITEAQLGNIIKERLKKVLNEGISDTTYHFTSLYSCVDILKNNTFNLTMSSNRSDAYDNAGEARISDMPAI